MLTLQYLPHTEIEYLTQSEKLNKLLKIVKTNKIILLEGRLKPYEESKLIELTMQQITRKFKGIEICTVYPNKNKNQLATKLKIMLYKLLLGNRQGLTIIGPATIIKEIKKNPNKIELLTHPTKRNNYKNASSMR